MTDRKKKFNEKFVEFFDEIMDLRDKLTTEVPDDEIVKLLK